MIFAQLMASSSHMALSFPPSRHPPQYFIAQKPKAMGKKNNASSSSSKPTSGPNSIEAQTGGETKKKARGHRQRGAGAVMVDKAPVVKDGVMLQSWQRLPSILLQEHCQREKRPRPSYGQVSLLAGDKGIKMQVILPDPKHRDKSLRFLPTVSSADASQAKENAALLALLHLTPTLPLERKLPEPYKTTWTNSTRAALQKKKGGEDPKNGPPALPPPPEAVSAPSKPPSSSISPSVPPSSATSSASSTFQAPEPMVLASALRYTSLKEKKESEEKRRVRAAKHRRDKERRHKHREDYRIMMSSKMRRICEDALGIQHIEVDDTEEDDETSSESEDEEEGGGEEGEEGRKADLQSKRERQVEDASILKALRPKGFTDRQILHAVHVLRKSANGGAWGGPEEVVDYLLLHLKEEALPAQFDPRGRNFDVVLPTIRPVF
ncbi:atp-dependent rna [Nannochloropsis gaditana]|uniref:Atp-dependent rna n=2 Tax=Nannochloropsis gaditana TaxID=72520 RepID=W7T0P8_9STRA|nr:atp-dependent rna [Nannochloropsis gaditana]